MPQLIPSSCGPVSPSRPLFTQGPFCSPSSSNEPGNGPLSHLAHVFQEMAPCPILSQREVSSDPWLPPIRSRTHPSEGHSTPSRPQHPSFSGGPALAPPPGSTIPSRQTLFLVPIGAPTLPSSRWKQTKAALPLGVHCIPTARLVLAS